MLHKKAKYFSGLVPIKLCASLNIRSGLEWLPHLVRLPPHIAGRSSWLWLPASKVVSSCSLHMQSRSQCSPGWTPTSGNWWRLHGQLVQTDRVDCFQSISWIFTGSPTKKQNKKKHQIQVYVLSWGVLFFFSASSWCRQWEIETGVPNKLWYGEYISDVSAPKGSS